jgi:hypothetical protein
MLVDRRDDMSPDGRLSLYKDVDGDIHVKVIPPMERKDDYAPSVEFVTHCARSPRTIEALQALFEAMRLDNEEHPLEGSFTLP